MLFLHLDAEIQDELKTHISDSKMLKEKKEKELLEVYNEVKTYVELKMRDHKAKHARSL